MMTTEDPRPCEPVRLRDTDPPPEEPTLVDNAKPIHAKTRKEVVRRLLIECTELLTACAELTSINDHCGKQVRAALEIVAEFPKDICPHCDQTDCAEHLADGECWAAPQLTERELEDARERFDLSLLRPWEREEYRP